MRHIRSCITTTFPMPFLYRAGMMVLLCALAVSVPASAGEGVFLFGNDALQLGRASSGVASPRSGYWSLLNPAAMVDLERRLDLNVYAILGRISYEPGGLLGNRINGDMKLNETSQVVSGSMVWPLESGVVGGGLFIPSGSGIEYPYSRNIFSRVFQGNRDRRMAYQHFRGVLAYAHRFDSGWALGVGLHLSLSRFRSDHITLDLRPAAYNNEWDQAYGVGLGVGIYRRWDRFALGASYSSRHWTQSMKEYRDLLYHALDTPHTVQAGVAYEVTPDVELTLDYKWMNWQDVGAYGAPMFGGGYSWRDQHGVRGGIEWNVSPRWTLMGGYAYSNSPVTEDNVFLAALVPATTEQHITAGVSHTINEKHQVHLVGVYGAPKKMRDTGRGGLFSLLGKGTVIETSGVSAMVGYSFLW